MTEIRTIKHVKKVPISQLSISISTLISEGILVLVVAMVLITPDDFDYT